MGWRNMTERVLSAASAAGAMGELVSYQPETGDPYEIRGVFDDDHTEPLLDVDTPVNETAPVLSVRESSLAARPVSGIDTLTLREQRYLVVDVQPDGQGTLDLVLNELEAAE
ncbi:MAG: hypothetical protein AAGG01_13955 [Planctomycetota bacterium]